MPHLTAKNLSPAVEKGDLTVRLISAFKGLLADKTLTPGCKLPPERRLAQRFGVNRSSLRQALKVLQIMGVLSQRVGDGTYLNRNASRVLQEPMEFLMVMEGISQGELFEARLIVESQLAARAAERATAQDLAALRKALFDMENSQSYQARLDADLAFHEAIFRASGNRVCHFIFKVIHRAILLSMSRVGKRMDLRRPLAFHKTIYAAIYHRKPEEASRRMIDHLLDAESQLLSPPTLQAEARLAERIAPIRRGLAERKKG
jgi:GntR family transcriptional repressor for pyruvate dehydrogenase complex